MFRFVFAALQASEQARCCEKAERYEQKNEFSSVLQAFWREVQR